MRSAAARTFLCVALVVAGCRGGEDGKDGAADGSLLGAGFKRAADATPASDAAEQDLSLPPERLWSPKELGFGKKASKHCFPQSEKDYSIIVGRAGDLTVRVSDFTAIFHTFTLDATRTGPDTLESRKKIVHELLDQELLALAARKKGYESTQVGTLLAKRELADKIRKDLRNQAAGEISEEAYKKYYKSHPEKYMIHPDQRRIVQIIIKGKKVAQKLIDRMKEEKISVAAFSKEARSLSLEPGAKDTSGRTGWFDREGMGEKGRVVPENVSAAAFKLKAKAEIHSSPLPSSRGWHVFMLLATREERWTPYSKVRPSIQAKFVDERQKVLIENMLESMKRNHPVSVYLNILEKVSPVPCM